MWLWSAYIVTITLRVRAVLLLAKEGSIYSQPRSVMAPLTQNNSGIGSASIKRIGRLPGPGIMVVSKSMPIAV